MFYFQCFAFLLSKLLSPPDWRPSTQPIGGRGAYGGFLLRQNNNFGVSPHYSTHSYVLQQLLPLSGLVAWHCQLAVLRVHVYIYCSVRTIMNVLLLRRDKVCKCNSLKPQSTLVSGLAHWPTTAVVSLWSAQHVWALQKNINAGTIMCTQRG